MIRQVKAGGMTLEQMERSMLLIRREGGEDGLILNYVDYVLIIEREAHVKI